MSTTKLTWQEFSRIRFEGREIHFTGTDNQPTRGVIKRMEQVYIGVLAFVLVIQTRKGEEKFCVSTFLNLEQPERFENGRIRAANPDGTHCVIYCDENEMSFGT